MHLAGDSRSQLNADQAACFTAVTAAISNDPSTAQFYLQGPGGTGKTFLYNTLCHHFRGLGKVVLCVASTGIAGLLLPDGRTAHSRFGIPLQLHDESTCSVTKNSQAGELLRKVDLIIWDEVPMQHKFAFDAVHRLMCDLRSTSEDVLFGGVPVLFGGDFAQTLPIVTSSRANTVSACLQHSFMWSRLRKLHLRMNMRVSGGLQDAEFISWIGRLSYDAALNTSITLPDYISQPRDVAALVQAVYPPEVIQSAMSGSRVRDINVFTDRAILTTKNAVVTELNALILSRTEGSGRVYYSVDTADVNDSNNGLDQLPVECLQSLELPSLPPSKLELKIGAPVMLLRNLFPQQGLCNGTRMIVTGLGRYSLEVTIIGGAFHGQGRVLPRIKFVTNETDMPFILSRKQFPVRLCFAMTINKSQGQSFKTVGVDLRSQCFSHGQFYVAVSRTSRVAGLHVLLPEPDPRTAVNVVYPEVLRDIN